MTKSFISHFSFVLRCGICNQRFLDAKLMQSHIGTHTLVTSTGEKKFKCPSCDQLYSSAKLLVEHIQNNHKRDEVEVGQIRNASLETKNEQQQADKDSVTDKKKFLEDPIMNRNKANIDSDDEGSDTSDDESDDEEKPMK